MNPYHDDSDASSCCESQGAASLSLSGYSTCSSEERQHLQDFGDVLRESMTTRQAELQQTQQPQPSLVRRAMTPRLWKNRRTKKQNDDGIPPPATIDEDILEEKSIATTMVEDGIMMEDTTSMNSGFFESHFLAWMMVLLSWFIIRVPHNDALNEEDEELGTVKQPTALSTTAFRWNWGRIIKLLAVMVTMFVILDLGLFIALMVQKQRTTAS